MSWSADNHESCCKCGSMFVNGPMYERARGSGQEQLRYRCVTCGYSWTTYTKDYPHTQTSPKLYINGDLVCEGDDAQAFIDSIDREWTPEEKAAKKAHLDECLAVYLKHKPRKLRPGESEM